MSTLFRVFAAAGVIAVCAALMSAAAADPPDTPDSSPDPLAGPFVIRPAPLNPLPGKLAKLIRRATPLNPQKTVILDVRKKRLFLHSQVSCRECVLEMLCCPEGQREHETILAVRSKAFVVHSGLLALGLEPGTPAAFSPEFKPPTGPEIAITLHWVDEDGELQNADAREWIRHTIHRYFGRPLDEAPPGIEFPHDELRYDTFNKELLWYGPMSKEQRTHLLTLSDDEEFRKCIEHFYEQSQSRAMEATFVFAGSRWDVFEEERLQRYAAEDGHLITVANFSSATIDIAEPSSADDGGQAYEGWTERIPPVGTPVIIELAAADDDDHEGDDRKRDEPKPDTKSVRPSSNNKEKATP